MMKFWTKKKTKPQSKNRLLKSPGNKIRVGPIVKQNQLVFHIEVFESQRKSTFPRLKKTESTVRAM